jgi:hypothetical protein
MREHIRNVDSSYVTPGWPGVEGVNGAQLSEGKYALPSKSMAKLLDYGDSKERRLGLVESTQRWVFVEVDDPVTQSISFSPRAKRQAVKQQSDDDKNETKFKTLKRE